MKITLSNAEMLAAIERALSEKHVNDLVSVQSRGTRNPRKVRPLMLAVLAYDVDRVCRLLDAKADINSKDSQVGGEGGRTALHYAAALGISTIVSELLKHGAKCDSKDNQGATPLSYAVFHGHEDVVEALLIAGADPNNRPKGSLYDTPLINAIRNRHFGIMRILLEKGAAPNLPDCSGVPPLAHAAALHDRTSVEDLLAAGAAVEATDKNGATALSYACFRNGADADAIMCLLEAGANPSHRDRPGHTPLDHLAVIRELLERHRKADSPGDANSSRGAEDHEAADASDRWGPQTPQPRFTDAAKRPKYREKVIELAVQLGGKPVEGQIEGTFVISATAEVELAPLQKDMVEQGAFVFFMDATSKRQLGVIPSTDKYQAIATFQTNGQNYGIGPGYIIAYLKNLEKTQPFILTGIGFDFVAGEFLSPVKGATQLAASLFDLCPDVEQQGCGSTEALAEELKKTGKFLLWWD